jgi:hypothetical protein
MKWIVEERKSFDDNKMTLTKAPILASPYYSKDFIIFYFTSEHVVDTERGVN